MNPRVLEPPPNTLAFDPHEACAIVPEALSVFYPKTNVAPEAQQSPAVAVVRVRGPLSQHRHYWFDSYESIKDRVRSALETKPKALVLSISSPGGVVAGCFETVSELRAMAEAADVELVAYCDGLTTSAAYALACAADRIVAPPQATLGSIGCIDRLVDFTKMHEEFGVRFAVVASGARKTDRDPAVKISDEAIEAAQARVDQLAGDFIDLVVEARGIKASTVRSLDAGLVQGTDALKLGLVDELGTFDELTLALASDGGSMTQLSEALAALRKISEGENKEEAAKARTALAALEQPAANPVPSATPAVPPAPAPATPDVAAIALAAQATADAAAEDLKKLRAEQKAAADAAEAQRVATERAALLASRPDLDEQLVAALSDASIETVRKVVEKAPRGVPRKSAGAITPQTTRGASQGTPTVPSDVASVMDRKMGLVDERQGVRVEGNTLVLGVISPKAAASALAEKEGEQ